MQGRLVALCAHPDNSGLAQVYNEFFQVTNGGTSAFGFSAATVASVFFPCGLFSWCRRLRGFGRCWRSWQLDRDVLVF